MMSQERNKGRREDDREFVKERMEELENIYSERTIAMMQGLIAGFSLFIIKLVLESMGLVFEDITELVLIGIIIIGVLTWVTRVFWRGKKFIGIYILGGILSTASGYIVAKEAWMLPTFLLGVFLAYVLTLIEWNWEKKKMGKEALYRVPSYS